MASVTPRYSLTPYASYSYITSSPVASPSPVVFASPFVSPTSFVSPSSLAWQTYSNAYSNTPSYNISGSESYSNTPSYSISASPSYYVYIAPSPIYISATSSTQATNAKIAFDEDKFIYVSVAIAFVFICVLIYASISTIKYIELKKIMRSRKSSEENPYMLAMHTKSSIKSVVPQ